MKGDGNCMPDAMLEELTWEDDPGSDKLFSQMYLRQQGIRHLIQYWDLLGQFVMEDIKMQYGGQILKLMGDQLESQKGKLARNGS